MESEKVQFKLECFGQTLEYLLKYKISSSIL